MIITPLKVYLGAVLVVGLGALVAEITSGMGSLWVKYPLIAVGAIAFSLLLQRLIGIFDRYGLVITSENLYLFKISPRGIHSFRIALVFKEALTRPAKVRVGRSWLGLNIEFRKARAGPVKGLASYKEPQDDKEFAARIATLVKTTD